MWPFKWHLPPPEFLYLLACTVLVLVQFSYMMRASFLASPDPLGYFPDDVSQPYAYPANLTGQPLPQYLPVTWESPPLLACVKSTKGGKPVGSIRDCLHRRGYSIECTARHPCTPCNRPEPYASHTDLEYFTLYANEPCSPCTGAVDDYCLPVPDEGPMCLDMPPAPAKMCEKCCTS